MTMIIAIAPAGTGQVKVEEFREAETSQDAVDAFVGEYTPPLQATDFVGHDTGWSSVQKPSTGNQWCYDHATASLVEVKIGADTLEGAKKLKIAEIDSRTDALIAAGFTYAGKVFSTSLASQAKMIGSHQIRDDANLTYPLRWNTIDDADAYDIANAGDLNGFYLTAVGTLRAHLDSGTALKDQVRAASTIAEVDAVVDNR